MDLSWLSIIKEKLSRVFGERLKLGRWSSNGMAAPAIDTPLVWVSAIPTEAIDKMAIDAVLDEARMSAYVPRPIVGIIGHNGATICCMTLDDFCTILREWPSVAKLLGRR